MGDPQGIEPILRKLRTRSGLSPEEVTELQAHIDQLENRAVAASSHHDTHSTPGSHYSQHHGIMEAEDFLDRPQEGRG